MNILRLATIALTTTMAVACTKPLPADTAAPSTGPAAADATAVEQAAAPVTLYNAYTANSLTPEGIAGEPGKSFKVGDKIYVGAVVHGQAAASNIKVEWSADSGAAASVGETSIPVTGASVATVELTQAGPLAVGDYEVLVYLDGKPGWELTFQVME